MRLKLPGIVGKSARALAHSKTLRAGGGAMECAAASWTAALLRRFGTFGLTGTFNYTFIILSWLAAAVVCVAAAPVELRGRVVCLAENNARPEISTNHTHIIGFKAADGQVYKLVRTRFSEALFLDSRLHNKELVLKGTILADSRSFNALTFRSIKNGVVHDLYYYCEICAIESVSPDICGCCRLPVELIEKPLEK